MNDTFLIRKYRPLDYEDVMHLFKLNVPEFFAASEEGSLNYYLSNHSENYYVVIVANHIVGCGGFNFTDDETMGIISWDIFHPNHQRKGYGSLLTRYRIEKIKEHSSINLITVRTSQFVYKFYEGLGFKLKETIKDFWAEGIDLYRMEYIVLS